VNVSEATRRLIRTRLDAEVGRIDKQAEVRVALAYPSPYHVGMSSLGYQRIYRAIQDLPGFCCERVFLPDGGDRTGAKPERPVSYESLRELAEFPVIALSVAYELELAGLIRMFDAAGIPPLARDRDDRAPFVLAGGPLTFSNPVPLGPYVDAIVIGEAEGLVERCLEIIRESPDKTRTLEALAALDHVYVPALAGETLPSVAACDDALLPAHSAIRTPHTELSNMFLIEAERGCSRGCTYCVMRRSTNGGMRLVPKEVILEKIPRDATKVGLVGAAVSDHPRIIEIVRALTERGLGVGLSSLRPDRLKPEFVEVLKQAGYRTLTTALDGPSERLRDLIERRGREPNYLAAAENAKKSGIERLKLYLMIGLPGETDEDIDECSRFVGELSRVIPIALGVAPFCSKRKTPLDRMPFAGVRIVEQRMDRLRRGLRGRADVRATSARFAWVEYVLAQGGAQEGIAMLDAVRNGGSFAHYRRAFADLGHTPNGDGYATATMPFAPERLPSRRRLPVSAPR
jgi:radical SAM superfamily enzyme YgiQ (UPF0313 family)